MAVPIARKATKSAILRSDDPISGATGSGLVVFQKRRAHPGTLPTTLLLLSVRSPNPCRRKTPLSAITDGIEVLQREKILHPDVQPC